MPLHRGRVPHWLADRMAKLGAAVVEAILVHYGHAEFLSRIADPFWFQALGAVMGMDWHSSGITTSVMNALKRGLAPRAEELGVYICGGRGNRSRNTPAELLRVAERRSLDGDALVQTSRLTARIDNNAIADSFQLYLHTFVLCSDGEWAVVQQGMNEATGMARRYHWHSAAVRDFTSAPHTGIVGEPQGMIMNLVDAAAGEAHQAMLAIVKDAPDKTVGEARRLLMPRHHEVRAGDVDLKRLGAVLALAYERDFRDFASLLLLETLGPRTLQTLALVAEVVHGAPTRFSDPARHSFALGGKDRHPFPVPLKTYDESVSVLRRALDAAKVGDGEKLEGFRRLERFARRIEERCDPRADFAATVAHEFAVSKRYGGRTVFDGADDARNARASEAAGPGTAEKPRPARKGQMPLFG